MRAEADVTLDATLALADTEVVVAEPGALDEALDALNDNPDVVYAEPDLPVSPASNDPQFANEWGLSNTGQTIWTVGTPDADIDAPEAWDEDPGAGVDGRRRRHRRRAQRTPTSPASGGNPGERGGGKETNGVDDDGNGFVDDWQRLGLRPQRQHPPETEGNCPRHARRRHDRRADQQRRRRRGRRAGGQGAAGEDLRRAGQPASSSVIAEAFDYAGDLNVDVVNASLGGLGTSQTVTNVITAHPNTLYVISAGNSADDAANYMPCNSPAANVVCVGSSDNRDLRSDFSNVSATAVDLFAPGSYVVSAYLNGELHGK